MAQFLSAIAIVVPDYDDALDYYVGTLGFELVEDSDLGDGKRWILVAPPNSRETRLLLAKATTDQQRAAVGNQTGGRVFLFLKTDDFERDYARYQQSGVQFVESPRDEPYGRVVVFEDRYGNRWDLIQAEDPH